MSVWPSSNPAGQEELITHGVAREETAHTSPWGWGWVCKCEQATFYVFRNSLTLASNLTHVCL